MSASLEFLAWTRRRRGRRRQPFGFCIRRAYAHRPGRRAPVNLHLKRGQPPNQSRLCLCVVSALAFIIHTVFLHPGYLEMLPKARPFEALNFLVDAFAFCFFVFFAFLLAVSAVFHCVSRHAVIMSPCVLCSLDFMLLAINMISQPRANYFTVVFICSFIHTLFCAHCIFECVA